MAKSSTRTSTLRKSLRKTLVGLLWTTPGAGAFNAGKGLLPTLRRGSRPGLGPAASRRFVMPVKGAREKSPWADKQTLNQQIEEPSRQPLRRIARALRPPATARFFRRATGSLCGVLPTVAMVLAWASPAVASGGMGPV